MNVSCGPPNQDDGPRMLHFISISLLPILLILAAASDVLSFRIPNWLNSR